jgi:hypothetical protein
MSLPTKRPYGFPDVAEIRAAINTLNKLLTYYLTDTWQDPPGGEAGRGRI